MADNRSRRARLTGGSDFQWPPPAEDVDRIFIPIDAAGDDAMRHPRASRSRPTALVTLPNVDASAAFSIDKRSEPLELQVADVEPRDVEVADTPELPSAPLTWGGVAEPEFRETASVRFRAALNQYRVALTDYRARLKFDFRARLTKHRPTLTGYLALLKFNCRARLNNYRDALTGYRARLKFNYRARLNNYRDALTGYRARLKFNHRARLNNYRDALTDYRARLKFNYRARLNRYRATLIGHLTTLKFDYRPALKFDNRRAIGLVVIIALAIAGILTFRVGREMAGTAAPSLSASSTDVAASAPIQQSEDPSGPVTAPTSASVGDAGTEVASSTGAAAALTTTASSAGGGASVEPIATRTTPATPADDLSPVRREQSPAAAMRLVSTAADSARPALPDVRPAALALAPEAEAASPQADNEPLVRDSAAEAVGELPVAAPAPAAVVPTDEQLVSTTLESYAAAYHKLDATAARRVWPAVDARALARAFETLEYQQFYYDNCRIRVTGWTATAVCDGWVSYVPKVGAKDPRNVARRWDFALRKRAGAWQIDRATMR